MSSTSFLGTAQEAWRLWSVSTNRILNLNDGPQKSDRPKTAAKREFARKAGDQSRNSVTGSVSASFTAEEVALHDSTSDCWIVIKDKVYDVTEFLSQHPGGPVIFTQAGRDATDTFTTFHSPGTWKLLQQFYIGDFVNNEPLPELLKDFRELRALFFRNQFFKSSKTWYFWKMFSTLAILATSIAVISFSSSLPALLVSAFLLALFWQQCGWMSHDFLHHQVFEGRGWNTYFGGFVWGNVFQGFSVGWWKTKHNLHHAAPNQCDDQYHPVDPDIDTLPLVAWSKDILATVDSEVFRSIIKFQHLLFVPLLFFARFSWLHSSWSHSNSPSMPLREKITEKATISLHYLLFMGVGFWFLPPSLALTWFLIAQLLCGAMLSGVFVISHNGMEVYNDSKDFVSAQIASTRDIQANMFNDWFTGGLNRQIEHHLFPSLPRHNLTKASPFVKALCKKHGLEYEDVSLMTGSHRVFDRLVKVAAAA